MASPPARVAEGIDSAPFAPGRRLLDFAADVEHEQRRSRAHQEHPAPSKRMPVPGEVREPWEQQGIGRRGDQIARRIAFLQQAGEEAAILFGEGLKGESCADAPLAAHGNAEEGTQDEQGMHRSGEGAGQFQDRIAGHIEHQRGPAAELVRHGAEEKGAHRPECEGEEEGLRPPRSAGHGNPMPPPRRRRPG